jgi:transposase InsO family protein
MSPGRRGVVINYRLRDNAPAEAFFKSLKTELIGDHIYRTRQEARTAIFEYIEVFYNRVRLHSYLDYVTPEEYESNAGIAEKVPVCSGIMIV